MRSPVLAVLASILTTLTLGTPARAQLGGGGNDETSEDLTNTATSWNPAAGQVATPGAVPAGITGTHLLISEIGVRGLNSATLGDSTEFIEIYNPTAAAVDLSTFYLSDANAYSALPDVGLINLDAIITDFAFRFPAGSSIGPGQVKVVAIDGGRYRRGTGVNADFMLFNAGNGATTAQKMVDVATNKGVNYPGFGSLTNGGEFVWLFSWNGQSDLVCDEDLVYWGAPLGSNAPVLKTPATCLDGPDAGPTTSCYRNDAGNPAGSFAKALAVPANGAGTRQRKGPETELVTTDGNGCIACAVIALSPSTLPAATAGQAYQDTLIPYGGTPPYVFTAKNGSLPPGLHLTGSTGVLYGCDPYGEIFTLDLATGVGTSTGVYAPSGAEEIEHDFLTGATFVSLGVSGERFDILTGAPLGSATCARSDSRNCSSGPPAPSRITSPSLRGCSAEMRVPLTKVPCWLPRSRTANPVGAQAVAERRIWPP